MTVKIPPADEVDSDIKRIAAVCSILASERRVAVIDALDSTDGDAQLSRVVKCVATDSTAVYNVRVTLYQTHLPLLDAADVVKYDWDAEKIRLGPRYRLVRDVLEAIREGSS